MRPGTSFARDWQLVKLARSMPEHDVAGKILRELLEDADPTLVEQVSAIAGRLGAEDGRALLAHSEEGFDAATLMEGLLLMWGIPCTSKEVPGGGLVISLEPGEAAIRETFVDELVAGPYLAGYARALQQDAVLERDADGRMMIRFPTRG